MKTKRGENGWQVANPAWTGRVKTFSENYYHTETYMTDWQICPTNKRLRKRQK